MQTRADRIRQALEARFAPTRLDVVDDSHRHAGHSGARPEGETHYGIVLVSAAFQGMSRVDRQRAVNDTLRAEFDTGLHALAMTLRAPDEVV